VNGVAILDRRPVDIADVEKAPPALAAGARNVRDGGNRAIAVMPMMRGDVAIGALSVVRLAPVSFARGRDARQLPHRRAAAPVRPFTGEPSADHLARYFHFDDTDKAFIRSRRGDHMRLGVAVQLGAVRFLGTFIDDLTEAPTRVQSFVGKQIGIKPEDKIAAYQASQWRWRHEIEIRERYGYQAFTDPRLQFR
jgi:Domain of unknown function (DUF4158)